MSVQQDGTIVLPDCKGGDAGCDTGNHLHDDVEMGVVEAERMGRGRFDTLAKKRVFSPAAFNPRHEASLLSTTERSSMAILDSAYEYDVSVSSSASVERCKAAETQLACVCETAITAKSLLALA
jgi:hypothetical protein